MSVNRIEFANFICHFGDTIVLLDRLEEIVLPSFTDDSLVRTRAGDVPTDYFFYEVEIVTLGRDGGDEIVAVSGDFVKNVELIRTQIFHQTKGLVHDPQTMPSSPSSTFLLILNNHQLLFLPRTPHAPGLKEFESTCKDFMARKYQQYIDGRYDELRKAQNQITKKALREALPPPSVHVVSHTNLDNISDFITRFKKLKSIDFRLLRPNPTIDAAEVFKEARSVLDRLGANSGKLVGSNNTEGMNKAEAIRIVNDATRGGNEDVVLKGSDTTGAVLSGSNADFKVSMPLDSLPPTRDGIFKKMFETFRRVLPAAVTATRLENPSHKDRLNGLAKRS